tara:strand:- start:536 stop:697 length:162 start_codon:yes stop_codon:yes gene_type:complete
MLPTQMIGILNFFAFIIIFLETVIMKTKRVSGRKINDNRLFFLSQNFGLLKII